MAESTIPAAAVARSPSQQQAGPELIEVEHEPAQEGHVDEGHDQGRADEHIGGCGAGEGAAPQQIARNQGFEPAELAPAINAQHDHRRDCCRQKKCVGRSVLGVVRIEREYEQAQSGAQQRRAGPVD